ncbi:hypothetical protein BN1723_016018 [Verticillium longisporum]|uniref:Uncharacterized protein n=1 Tax=Verticillium longisporum TaxID=100787 RepID=A0A0G4N6Q7_VERLO|nr:hypothetical protein BN1723_016018 [Verticillium longisporum]
MVHGSRGKRIIIAPQAFVSVYFTESNCHKLLRVQLFSDSRFLAVALEAAFARDEKVGQQWVNGSRCSRVMRRQSTRMYVDFLDEASFLTRSSPC